MANRHFRVLLVDDHALLRGQHRPLLNFPRVEVVAEAADGREALAMVETHQPEIVLIDVQTRFLNGCEVAEVMFPRVRLVLMSIHDCEAYIPDAIRCGAVGFVRNQVIPAEVKLMLQAYAPVRRTSPPEQASREPSDVRLDLELPSHLRSPY